MKHSRFPFRGGIAALLIVLSGCVSTRPDAVTVGAECPVVVERGDRLAFYRVPVRVDDGEPVDVPLLGAASMRAAPGLRTLSMRPVDTRGLGLTSGLSIAHAVTDATLGLVFGGTPQFFSTDTEFHCVDGETHRFLASPSVWGETTLIEVIDQQEVSR